MAKTSKNANELQLIIVKVNFELDTFCHSDLYLLRWFILLKPSNLHLIYSTFSIISPSNYCCICDRFNNNLDIFSDYIKHQYWVERQWCPLSHHNGKKERPNINKSTECVEILRWIVCTIWKFTKYLKYFRLLIDYFRQQTTVTGHVNIICISGSLCLQCTTDIILVLCTLISIVPLSVFRKYFCHRFCA